MVSESDWIRLTPKLVRGEPPDTIAEYGKRALSPYCHLLRNVRQDGPMRVRDDGALEFSSAELAAIPIVKALMEACRRVPLATIAHRMDVEGGGGDCVRQILDALAPFEEAPDG